VNQFFLTSSIVRRSVTLIAAAAVAFTGYRAVNIWIDEQNTPPVSETTIVAEPAIAATNKSIDYRQIEKFHLFGETPKANMFRPKAKAIKAPETRLKLQLIGVIFDQSTEDGLAIVSELGKPQKTYRKGEKLPGNATLYAIEQGRIILERNSRHEALTLKKPEVKGKGRGALPNNPLPALSKKAPTSRQTRDFKQKIKFM